MSYQAPEWVSEVENVVHAAYAELRKQARVTEHLPSLVESEARDVLESRPAVE